MQRALTLAKQAARIGEVPVGAVIVDTRHATIISSFHNMVEARGDATAHAELLAIQDAMQHYPGNTRLEHCDLYVTLEPCPMCAQAISFARIRRLYFAAYDTKGGAVVNGPKLYEHLSCFHKPEIVAGVMEEKAQQLLQNFFREKRS